MQPRQQYTEKMLQALLTKDVNKGEKRLLCCCRMVNAFAVLLGTAQQKLVTHTHLSTKNCNLISTVSLICPNASNARGAIEVESVHALAAFPVAPLANSQVRP